MESRVEDHEAPSGEKIEAVVDDMGGLHPRALWDLSEIQTLGWPLTPSFLISAGQLRRSETKPLPSVDRVRPGQPLDFLRVALSRQESQDQNLPQPRWSLPQLPHRLLALHIH